ncbi:hypothetical protein NKG94_17535 [Micromonospora sp. M12]
MSQRTRTDAATRLDELAAEVARLAAQVVELQQARAERADAGGGAINRRCTRRSSSG